MGKSHITSHNSIPVCIIALDIVEEYREDGAQIQVKIKTN